jgi:rSAM/selenodomain-associated transferase 2
MLLSIVIPVLNEAERLPQALRDLAPLRERGAEVIVVDGGSEDATPVLATAAGVLVVHSNRGRAAQMNAGALQASGDVFLFLHADTALPGNAPPAIKDALADGRHVWGRFDVYIEGQAWMLRVVACLMNYRSRLTGIATGDQAIFVTRRAFATVGGFPDQPLMEDVEISKRLCKLSGPACLRTRALTSGRRWETRGVWRTIFLMWRLRWAYSRGVAASELVRSYK